MILDGNSCERPEIEYPCEWGYKLIGYDTVKLEACIFDIVGERAYTVKPGNTSRTGKFQTINMSCQVQSEEDRNKIFKAFSDHEDVKMII